jgi:hypothetical protein
VRDVLVCDGPYFAERVTEEALHLSRGPLRRQLRACFCPSCRLHYTALVFPEKALRGWPATVAHVPCRVCSGFRPGEDVDARRLAKRTGGWLTRVVHIGEGRR